MSKFMPGKILKLLYQQGFALFQMLGWHVTRVGFNSPIPDTRTLRRKPEIWTRELPLDGLDLNIEGQKSLAEAVWKLCHAEYEAFPLEKTGNPAEYYLNNGAFGYVSGQMHYGMLRYFKPKNIIEVGAGYSTLVSLAALKKNAAEGNPGNFISIEPYPPPFLKHATGIKELVVKKVEDLPPGFFDRLGENDVLFIDSSHTVKIGGDVNFLVLEVLPRLKKGVIVHIHDIHFPFEYFKSYVLEQGNFWQEQYLVQAFLMYNGAFKVLWCASYMHHKHPELLSRYFSPYPVDRIPTSLYIQKKGRYIR